ncbi:hypothetical protein I302_100409 [Kwoniella bestiolae CBS 10118]|uniref:Uncharacterized protein n=1 Tax=Kwoniella bestiolae CBS 10118 TaxID=1296100 RepID=A0A1B9G4Z4_9TREE|nr:hypothetical protein I302_03784 [Kwoniella bestiolae CBS 10118]OCF26107.1 hypothetical protein I302_03784 [Kwoniella bestiolae CBS 10118]
MVYKELADTLPSFYLDPEFFCPTIWSEVETLVYLVPPIGNDDHYLPHEDRDLSGLLPKLKKLIWIFDPSDIDPEAEGDQCNLHGEERQLLSELLAKNPELKLIIVNVGSANLRLMKGSREPFDEILCWYAEKFQDWYWDVLDSSSFYDDDEDDTKKTNYPYYLNVEEFVEREEWYEWFDPEEIIHWKRMNREIKKTIPKGEDVEE